MRNYKFAIIGNGYMAQRYIACIERNLRAELRVVINRGTTVRRYYSDDPDGPFASDDECFSFLRNHGSIDAIIVCSPDHTHAEYVAQLLPCGKAVVCEKPLARTEEEFRRLFDLAPRGRNNLIVGMNCRFRSKVLHLKGLIECGAFGEVKFVNAAYYSNIMPIIERKTKTWWLEYPQGVIPFLHGGAIHLIDALRFLMGEVDEIICIPVSGLASQCIGGDGFVVIMKFVNQSIANLVVTGTSLAPNRFQISIESDVCSVDDNNRYVRDTDTHSVKCMSLPVEDFKDLDRQLAHVIDVLDGAAEPINSLMEAYRNFRVIKACEESVVSRSWIPVHVVAQSHAEMNRG